MKQIVQDLHNSASFLYFKQDMFNSIFDTYFHNGQKCTALQVGMYAVVTVENQIIFYIKFTCFSQGGTN